MILSLYVPRLLRKKYGVTDVQIVNPERLKQSISAGHGILLTPNHCRDEDPLVMGLLARAVRRPFFIMASWHVFMNDRVEAFLLDFEGDLYQKRIELRFMRYLHPDIRFPTTDDLVRQLHQDVADTRRIAST